MGCGRRSAYQERRDSRKNPDRSVTSHAQPPSAYQSPASPDTDAINALQVELLRRWREAEADARPDLQPLILLSVNALAAAMQSTG